MFPPEILKRFSAKKPAARSPEYSGPTEVISLLARWLMVDDINEHCRMAGRCNSPGCAPQSSTHKSRNGTGFFAQRGWRTSRYEFRMLRIGRGTPPVRRGATGVIPRGMRSCVSRIARDTETALHARRRDRSAIGRWGYSGPDAKPACFAASDRPKKRSNWTRCNLEHLGIHRRITASRAGAEQDELANQLGMA